MQLLLLSTYIIIACFHIFLVKSIPLLLFSVLLFEIARFLALYFKLKITLIILALISSVFIIYNYYNYYNKAKHDNNSTIQQINNSNDEYNSNEFISPISRENNVNNTHSLLFYLIPSLIVLVELSLAYKFISSNKKKKHHKANYRNNIIPKKPNSQDNIDKNSQLNNTNIMASAPMVKIKEEKTTILDKNTYNNLDLTSYGEGKNKKYYKNNQEISKSSYYRYLKKIQNKVQ